jgi:hypothetical protein
MGLDTAADAETERLLAAATRYGGVLLPPLTSGELYALGGDGQVPLEGDEEQWWAGMTEPGRASMKALAVDMLISRELLVRPDAQEDLAVAPAVALTLAARQDPSVMVACARPDGVTAWAPRLYGLAEPGHPPQAMVLEIIMDKIHGLFGPLHEFGLMSVDAAARFVTWWAQTPFRARHARKEPPRHVSVFRGLPDGELACDELAITPARDGTLGVTLEPHDQPATSVVCAPGPMTRLVLRMLKGMPPQ